MHLYNLLVKKTLSKLYCGYWNSCFVECKAFVAEWDNWSALSLLSHWPVLPSFVSFLSLLGCTTNSLYQICVDIAPGIHFQFTTATDIVVYVFFFFFNNHSKVISTPSSASYSGLFCWLSKFVTCCTAWINCSKLQSDVSVFQDAFGFHKYFKSLNILFLRYTLKEVLQILQPLLKINNKYFNQSASRLCFYQ